MLVIRILKNSFLKLIDLQQHLGVEIGHFLKLQQLFVVIFLSHLVLGQSNNDYSIKYFTLEDGLSQVSSNDLLKDSSGFVWIATQDGLNRFDGKIFKHFKHNEKDSLTVSGNLINRLLEDNSGRIWVGTIGNGLCYYDPHLDVFHRVKLKKSNGTNEIISAIVEDKEGNIWVGSRISGLHKLSPSGTTFVQENYYNQPITTLSIDENNYLWAAGFNGRIFRSDLAKNEALNLKPQKNARGHIQSFYKTDKSLLVGSDEGFFVYDLKNNEVNLVELSKEDNIPTRHVLAFLKHNDSTVWVATGNGLYLYDWVNERVTNKILYSGDSKKGLSSSTVQALLKISEKQILVGTANYLNLIDFSEPYFKNFSKNLKGKHLLSDNVIFSILKENNNLWIGTSDGGLNLLKNGKQYYFVGDQNNTKSISGGVIRAIVKDEINQRMWLATTRGLSMIDLKTFDPDSPEFTVFKHNPNDENSINNDFLKDLILDKNNNLWGVTYGQGIFRLDYINESEYSIVKYKNDGKTPNSLKNDFVHCIGADNENNIWIGTQEGLTKLSFEVPAVYGPPNFEHFENIENEDKSLSHNSVYDILIDQKNRIWVGTRSGFNLYLGNKEFESWKAQKQFSNDVVYSIQDDENGNLWLGTNDGMVMFNTESKNFVQYGVNDGIQSKEFDIHARYRDSNGTIYLGGIGGVTYFNPNDLSTIDVPKPLYFSEFRIKDEIIGTSHSTLGKLPQALFSTERLTFKKKQFPFYLRFSSIDYRRHKDMSYGYKLNPSDSEWNMLADPEIQFLNLPTGNYTLQVNGFSRGKEWNQPPLEMKLDILPPWWATWWAYLFYLSIAAMLLYGFYRFQISRKLEVAENKKLKEINQLRNSLFTNITHEFRTPLTVILGMTESLKEKSKTKTLAATNSSLEMIERNGLRLLDLVNEMLDLAKLESGKMAVNNITSDIVPFIKYVTESFQSLAKESDITVVLYSEIDELVMDFDDHKMQSIISNLLSNAIKFSKKNDKVIVHVNKIHEKESEYLIVKIRDNGMGISKEALPHIFNHFYQADSTSSRSGEGTGIGLALTKELVELLNGSIQVKSELGKGTEFLLKVPVYIRGKIIDKMYSHTKDKLKENPTGNNLIIAEENSELPIVLIIEDNMDVAIFVQDCLQGKYTTIHAENGFIGLDKAIEKVPDIIICDVMMPGKDGFEVCRELKSDERTDHIPIVMLTAKVTQKDRLEGFATGVDAYLSKPFIKDELFARLDQLVKIRKQLRAKYEKGNLNEILQEPTDSKETKFIQKVVQLIQEKIDNPNLNSEQLANECSLSESQLYRKLKAVTGKSTAVFIRSVRLEKGKELIVTTDKTISEVAYEVGFNDPSWFSRAFKTEYGTSPTDFRDSQY